MKQFILILSIVIFSTTLRAQVSFNGRTTETYAYLTGATELQPSNIWGLNEVIPLKLEFPMVLDNRSYDSVFVSGGHLVFKKNGANEAIIWGTFLSVSDRKLYDNKFKSRILYQVAGSSPNRIQKFEFKAFGFNDEFEEDLSFTDSGSIQIWVYETGNKVEVKYGPSKPTKTFTFTSYRNSVGFSFLKHNPVTFPFLTGSVTNPTLINDTASSAELTAYPTNGSVYTFTLINNTNGVGMVKELAEINCYPNPTNGLLTVDNPSNNSVELKLCDPSGKAVLSFCLDAASSKSIDLSTMAKGVYYFQCSSNAGTHSFRVVHH